LVESVLVSMQVPEQTTSAAEHLHTPLWHHAPAAHCLPQLPQFLESLLVSLQIPEQTTSAAGHLHSPLWLAGPSPARRERQRSWSSRQSKVEMHSGAGDAHPSEGTRARTQAPPRWIPVAHVPADSTIELPYERDYRFVLKKVSIAVGESWIHVFGDAPIHETEWKRIIGAVDACR
jgi:hypothetical protein